MPIPPAPLAPPAAPASSAAAALPTVSLERLLTLVLGLDENRPTAASELAPFGAPHPGKPLSPTARDRSKLARDLESPANE